MQVSKCGEVNGWTRYILTGAGVDRTTTGGSDAVMREGEAATSAEPVRRLVAGQFPQWTDLAVAPMWERARGWVLCMGLVALPYYRERNPPFAAMARRMLDQALDPAG